MWISIYIFFIWLSRILLIALVLFVFYNLARPFLRRLKLPQKLLLEISWRATGYLALGMAAVFLLRGGTYYLSTWQLERQLLALASEVNSFADEQQRKMPAEGEPNWEEYTRGLAQQVEENRSLYHARYQERVKRVRQELRRRGLRDQVLDQLDSDPSTPVLLKALAERLEVLAGQLR